MHSDESPRASTQDETSQDDALQRGLSARHLTMISIGGAIGTGLFVASGKTIHDSGPGGALVAYGLIGVMVFLLMQSLGEMAAYIPVAGSFGEYGARFISPSFGFATGWNFWYNWAITVAAELVAASLVMKYWFPDVPGWVWSAVFLSILVALNALSARAYGEGEFWFALVKVVVVVVFLVLGVLIIAGILGDTINEIEAIAESAGVDDDAVISAVRADYKRRYTSVSNAGAEEEARVYGDPESALRRAVIDHLRQRVHDLRFSGRIDDSTASNVNRRLDVETLHINGPIDVE